MQYDEILQVLYPVILIAVQLISLAPATVVGERMPTHHLTPCKCLDLLRQKVHPAPERGAITIGKQLLDAWHVLVAQ